MALDFNTPICQHFNHRWQAVPAVIRMEHSENGVKYFCESHPLLVLLMIRDQQWTAERINQHTQPTQERG